MKATSEIGKTCVSEAKSAVQCRSRRWAAILDKAASQIAEGPAFTVLNCVGQESRADVRESMRKLRDNGIERVIVLCDGFIAHADSAALFIVEDHVNWSGDNPLIGLRDSDRSDRFVDMNAAYDPETRDLLAAAARDSNIEIRSGTAFDPPENRPIEPPAAGWPTVPGLAFSVIAARQAGLAVGAVAWLLEIDGTGPPERGLGTAELVHLWALAAERLATVDEVS